MKCPHCKEELEITDCIDIEMVDDDELITKMIGECPKCANQSAWTRVYTLEKEKDCKEVNI